MINTERLFFGHIPGELLPATAKVVWVTLLTTGQPHGQGSFEHEDFTAVRLTRGPGQRREPNSLEKTLAPLAPWAGPFRCLFLALGEGPRVRGAELLFIVFFRKSGAELVDTYC